MSSAPDAKDPPPVKGKVSFLHPESSKVEPPKSSSGLPAPPSNGTEWVRLATQLLSSRNHEMEKRAIDVCQEAALALLDEAAVKKEAAARARQENLTQAHQHRQQQQQQADMHDDDEYSPREQADEGEELDAAASRAHGKSTAAGRSEATTEQVEAAYVLVAGCVAALERNTADSVAKAVSLAQQACQAWPAPPCSLALAWAQLRASTKLPERGAQGLALSATVTAASSAAAALLRLPRLSKDDHAWLARTGWLLAALGEREGAQLCVNRLLQSDPSHLMGLLLLSLLHTSAGDSGSAMEAAVMLLQKHPDDIGGAVLMSALRRHMGSTETDGDAESEDTLNEELGVALARVRAFTDNAVAGNGLAKKRTLKAFCIHPAPGESAFEEGTAAVAVSSSDDTASAAARASGVLLTSSEASRRAAGYWALLAHLCVRLGAFHMAEVVIEAGLDYVSSAKVPLYRKAFADLLCSRARLALVRLWSKVPPTASAHGTVRDVNLLSLIQPASGTAGGGAAARTAEISLFSLRAEVRGAAIAVGDSHMGGGGIQNSDSEPLADASRLLNPRDLGAIFTYLVKACEVFPDHPEARHLMGIIRLLESSQPDLPKRTVEQKRACAANFFTETMRTAPLYGEPQLGLGCVREAQGALDVALDLYASAAELSFREPLIPYDRLLFLFE